MKFCIHRSKKKIEKKEKEIKSGDKNVDGKWQMYWDIELEVLQEDPRVIDEFREFRASLISVYPTLIPSHSIQA